MSLSIQALRDLTAANATPSGASDKVTAPELRAIFSALVDSVRDKGVETFANVAAMSASTSAETLLAYVEGVGLFRWKIGGVANGYNIFAAADAGTWNMIVGDTNAPHRVNLTTNGQYIIPAGFLLRRIIITPVGATDINIGTTNGGGEILEVSLGAGEEFALPTNVIARTATTLHINGIVGSTDFLMYLDKL